MKKYNIDVGLSFIIAIAVIIIIDGENNMTFWTLSAMLLHELGHIAAAELLGADILRIRLCAAGAEIVLRPSASVSYIKEIAIRAAGPAAGILAALIFSPAGHLSGNRALFTAAGINLVLSAVNLIPIKNSDGGMILYYAVHWIFGPRAAQATLDLCTVVLGGAVVLLGAAVFVRTGSNLSLMIFGIFICFGDFMEKIKNAARKK